jgi:drug/metabolite transporter (DMT)-like permease
LTPISFMQLPLVTGLAWLLFGEVISIWVVVGSLIIFGANGYIAHREATLSRKAATTAPVEAAKPGE